MHLWHTSLIKVLPLDQLIEQWFDLAVIADAIQKKGTINYALVNFVLDYDYDHFISYAYYVREELTRRGCGSLNNVWNKITSLKLGYTILPIEIVYLAKMNQIYFDACWYNLYEKHLCGEINDEDWKKIENQTEKV